MDEIFYACHSSLGKASKNSREDEQSHPNFLTPTRKDEQSHFFLRHTIIYACYKRSLTNLGAKWFRMMLENGVRPNIATFGMLMNLYQKSWRVKEAEFAFSKIRDLNIVCHSAYPGMITTYTRMGFYDKAEEVIGFLTEDEVVFNLENWLVVLNAYSKQGKLVKTEKVLLSMGSPGFSPNIVAYNTLITGYGKVSNMDAAQRLCHELEKVELEPDKTTYRTMIEGWGRVNNFKEANWYCAKLKRLGSCLTHQTCLR